MMKKIVRKVFFIGFMLLIVLMSHPFNVAAVSDELMKEVKTRIITAIENNDLYVDLTDLEIQVDMYSDRIGQEYQEFISLADDIVKSNGSYDMGSIQRPFCEIGFDSNPSPENTDPYGVGKNDLVGASISYDSLYFDSEEKPDKNYFDGIKAIVSENYQKALSLVDSRMSEVEKALILYDYIIAASNYPDSIGVNNEGNEEFEDKYHIATNLFYEGIAVCSGNAEAYVGLLRDNGIPAIVVESKEMNHEWVMLEIAGEWFHADPTWDNSRYEIFTECNDYTDDPWDLGAAAHDYFLKSDEEMEQLSHYGWELKYGDDDFGISELPIADHSGAWDDQFFSSYTDGGNRSRFNYIDGVWYFVDRDTGSVISYQDGEYSNLDLSDGIKYVHGDGKYLFYCTDEAVFAYEPTTGIKYVVITAADYGEQAIISEMRVIYDQIDTVILTKKNDDGSYSSLSESTQISPSKFSEVNVTESGLTDLSTLESENDRQIFLGGIILISVIGLGVIIFLNIISRKS